MAMAAAVVAEAEEVTMAVVEAEEAVGEVEVEDGEEAEAAEEEEARPDRTVSLFCKK